MTTMMVAFPFEQFGSSGAGAGACLLADAVREMLADNRREKQPSRSCAYQSEVRLREFAFETLEELNAWRGTAARTARTALQRGEFLIWLGGNHLSVLPVLEEFGKLSNPHVIQCDAHLDVYNLSDCTTALSHGNFLLHADAPLPPFVHVGNRDLFLPHEHVAQHFQTVITAEQLACTPDTALAAVHHSTAAADKLWIDIDCDVLDPAYFPATGHTLPFGLAPLMLLRLVDAVWSERVAGISLSEFEPARDRNDQSLGLLIWLLEWLLLKRYEKRAART